MPDPDPLSEHLARLGRRLEHARRVAAVNAPEVLVHHALVLLALAALDAANKHRAAQWGADEAGTVAAELMEDDER